MKYIVLMLTQWLMFFTDSFVGGHGEACSHMAEGLSTALQLFDDLDELREPKYVLTACGEWGNIVIIS